MAAIRRLLTVAAIAATVGACDVYDRLDAAERDLARSKQTEQSLLSAVDQLWDREVQLEGRVSRLSAELRGVSTTQASVPADGRVVVIYGNGSGMLAAATLTTLSTQGPGKVSIFTRRIVRPSDRLHNANNTSSLPPDFEATEPLDVSAAGARRQLVIGCGYEVAAKGEGATARIGILVKYGQPCAQ